MNKWLMVTTDGPIHPAQQIVRDYLIHAPEQGDWEWEDHCDGIAGGLLTMLHRDGWRVVQTTDDFHASGYVALVIDEWKPPVDFTEIASR